MNFPSASPNENMNIDNSINPMPARRAERSSAAGEILAKRVIDDRRVLLAPSWPGSSRPSTSFVPRCFKDVDARDKCSDRRHSRHLFGDMTDTFSARQVDGSDMVGGKE